MDVNKKWKKQGKKKQEINNTTDTNNKAEVEKINSIDIIDIVDECFKGAHEDQTKITQLDNSICPIKRNGSCQNKPIQIVLDEQHNNIRDNNNRTEVEEVNSIDIMDIVDECFKEEHEEQTRITQTSALGNSKCAIKKNESCQDRSVQIVLDEQNHSAVCFTIEEEFQVHDLIAKREFMNDIFAQIKNNVLSTHENDSMVTKTEDGKWQYEKRMMVASQNLGQQFGIFQIIKNHLIEKKCWQDLLNFKMCLMNSEMLRETLHMSKYTKYIKKINKLIQEKNPLTFGH